MDTIRIDKWLWAVRLFKTRSQASEACRKGNVKMNGQPVKASREVGQGNIIDIHQNPIVKTVEVKVAIKNRVGAKLVDLNMVDLTPQSEYDKLIIISEMNPEWRDRGTGRPTKKDRRSITKLKDNKL